MVDMVYTLTGPNSFELEKQLQQMRRLFVEAYGDVGVEVIQVETWDPSQIKDTLSALPFLSERRFIVVRGLAENKRLLEDIATILDAVAESNDVVLVIPKLDKRSSAYKVLKKQTEYSEYLEIDILHAPSFIQAEAKNNGAEISASDARYLADRIGPNQMMLAQEVKKLATYNHSITRQSIDELTERTPQSTIFELLEASFKGDVEHALYLYEDQRAQEVEPLAIEAMFVWQLHILLLIKAAGNASVDTVASESGISPFVLKKSLQLVRYRSLAQIKSYVTKLAELELAIKTQSVQADDLLKNYIILLADETR